MLVGRVADGRDHLDEQREVLEARKSGRRSPEAWARSISSVDERLDPAPGGGEPLGLPRVGYEQGLLEAAVGGLHLLRALEEAATSPSHGSSISSASAAIALDRGDLLLEQLVDQRLAVREAPVDGPDADAGVPGDVVEADVDAALGEEDPRRREDPLPVALGVLAQRPRATTAAVES